MHPAAQGRAARVEVVHAATRWRSGPGPGPGRPRRRAAGDRAGQPRPRRRRRTPPRRCGPRSSTSGPKETAPEHRHSQNAFRFVVEGEGVWTVVDGDPVRMSRGDFLLTPGWRFHGHHNETDQPMAWLDGLDIPFSYYTDVGFFEFGADRVTDYATPELLPQRTAVVPPRAAPAVGAAGHGVLADRRLPVGAHRRRADRTAAAGGRGPARPPSSRATPPSATSTRPPAATSCRRSAPSSTGCGPGRRHPPGARSAPACSRCSKARRRSSSTVSSTRWRRATCSSCPPGCRGRCRPRTQFDLFRFSDAPIMERLHFDRVHVEGEQR